MDAALRAIAHRALAVGHRPQHRYLPGAEVAEREGVTLLFSSLGDRDPGFHRVTVFSDTPVAGVFALADAFFHGRASGYTVMLEAGARPDLERTCRAQGRVIEHADPAMALPAIPREVPPPPPGLAIRRVTDEAALLDFWQAAGPEDAPPIDPAASFDPFANLTRYFNPSLACALDPDIALFVGYIDGRAVATSALYRTDEIAEIGAVGTLPAYRRRGIGTAMTGAAVAEGAARGCTVAALRATDMGRPVYRAMGFQDVFTLRIFGPAPHE